MNTFFRSTRFLDRDGFGRSTMGLVLVALLMSAWLAWFFLARLTLYAVSEEAALQEAAHLVARFPTTALLQIQPGQVAHLRLDDFPSATYGTVRATVAQVDFREGQLWVELELHPAPDSRVPLHEGLTGEVLVAVDHLSPAALLLQSASQRVGQP